MQHALQQLAAEITNIHDFSYSSANKTIFPTQLDRPALSLFHTQLGGLPGDIAVFPV